MPALTIDGMVVPVQEAERKLLPAIEDRSRGLDNSLRVSAAAGTDQYEWEVQTALMAPGTASTLEAKMTGISITAEGDVIGDSAVLCRGALTGVSYKRVNAGLYRVLSFTLHQAGATAPDTTPPTFSSATLAADGVSLDVTLIEGVSPPILPASGITGFAVEVNGVAATISSAVRQSSTVVRLTLSSAAAAGNTVTVSYTPGNVTDSEGNAMEAFSAQSVTNNAGAGGSITAQADWAYHAKDWDGVTAAIPSAVTGGPDATHSGVVKGTGTFDYFHFVENGDYMRIPSDTGLGADDATWIFILDSAVATATTHMLVSNRWGDTNTSESGQSGYRLEMSSGNVRAAFADGAGSSAATASPAVVNDTRMVIRIVRDTTAQTIQAWVNGVAGAAVAEALGNLGEGLVGYIGLGGPNASLTPQLVGRLYSAGYWRGQILSQTDADAFDAESQA